MKSFIKNAIKKNVNSLKKLKFFAFVFFITHLISQASFAGYDYAGPIQKIWSKPEGVYLQVAGIPTTYCAAGWYGINVFIPASSPDFVVNFGIAMTAMVKNRNVYLANLSVFNGSTVCDISKTSYGIVLL